MAQERKAQPEVNAPAPLRVTPGKGSKQDPFDRIIHERQRLAIVSALAVNDTLSFTALKELLGMSDGNLSVHAQKLEGAGYITCTKRFEGRLPKTEYKLTKKGRDTLHAYLDHMEAVIAAVRRP